MLRLLIIRLQPPAVHNVMFNALHVVNNNAWDIFSFSLYLYINVVHNYMFFLLDWVKSNLKVLKKYNLIILPKMDYVTNYIFCHG